MPTCEGPSARCATWNDGLGRSAKRDEEGNLITNGKVVRVAMGMSDDESEARRAGRKGWVAELNASG
jgi:hypothetical protein